ncbi:MAG TPA: PAS domain-containing protein [Candidatus Angelobacter sp.]
MESHYSEIPDAIAELVRINPVPTILIDMTTFTVAVVNTAASTFLGYSEAEMVGQSITNFVPLDDIAAVQHSVDEPPPEGETQWRCVTKDGKILFVKLKYRETVYQGRPARFVVLIESRSTPFA